MILLKGYIPKGFVGDDKDNPPKVGPIRLNFTDNEQETAVAIKKVWSEKGLAPQLFRKNYDGCTRLAA